MQVKTIFLGSIPNLDNRYESDLDLKGDKGERSEQMPALKAIRDFVGD